INSMLFIGLMVGCQAKSTGPRGAPQTMDRSQSTVVIETPQGDALGRMVSDVQNAPTAEAEASALRRLRDYVKDNGYTYSIRSFRPDDNAPIKDPSVRHDPVRSEVTIFRGRDTLRSFQFMPRDNRNLSQLGE
ncbi:MAG: hypothetical protein QOE14_2558, partial [Humisphaera sp.]|nr:hypothetical protein [Humisphaera sp.]